MSETKQPAKQEKVKLLEDGHTHQGVERKKGDIITVTEAQAKRLVDKLKIAERHAEK